MRAKVMALILCGALTAAALLVVRQQRLQAVYEMTRALDRAAEDDRALWKLRLEISKQITPSRVREMADSLGPLRPIPRRVSPITRAGASDGLAQARDREGGAR